MLTELQTITRPDYVWPEVWTNIGKAAKKKEKRLRWIYFIDPDDKEFLEFFFLRKKLEIPLAPAMLCKRDSGQIEDLIRNSPYQDAVGLDGEAIEFEWKSLLTQVPVFRPLVCLSLSSCVSPALSSDHV